MKYAKAVAAIIGAGATAALGIWGPDTSAGRILVVVAALCTAAGVYLVPNKPAQ